MDFLTFCHGAGLMPKHIEADGKWHRCPTESHPKSRNGAFKLMPDGLIGFAQDWATHQEPMTWHPNADVVLPPIDHAAIARRKAEDAKRQADAIRAARRYFDDSRILRDEHPYLTKKGLTMVGAHGLRVDEDGWLLMPIHRKGSFASVQRIAPDGTKRFWLDAPTGGGYYVITRRDAVMTVLCEGLATGLAIFAACPTAQVVVCLNAGNLARVAADFMYLRSTALVVIAADNDHRTAERTGINPGIAAANAAADVLGCGVAVPDVTEGSDWLDWRNEQIDRRQTAGLRRTPLPTIRRTVDSLISLAMTKAAKPRRIAL